MTFVDFLQSQSRTKRTRITNPMTVHVRGDATVSGFSCRSRAGCIFTAPRKRSAAVKEPSNLKLTTR
jgi:hypothetical protein